MENPMTRHQRSGWKTLKKSMFLLFVLTLDFFFRESQASHSIQNLIQINTPVLIDAHCHFFQKISVFSINFIKGEQDEFPICFSGDVAPLKGDHSLRKEFAPSGANSFL